MRPSRSTPTVHAARRNDPTTPLRLARARGACRTRWKAAPARGLRTPRHKGRHRRHGPPRVAPRAVWTDRPDRRGRRRRARRRTARHVTDFRGELDRLARVAHRPCAGPPHRRAVERRPALGDWRLGRPNGSRARPEQHGLWPYCRGGGVHPPARRHRPDRVPRSSRGTHRARCSPLSPRTTSIAWSTADGIHR